MIFNRREIFGLFVILALALGMGCIVAWAVGRPGAEKRYTINDFAPHAGCQFQDGDWLLFYDGTRHVGGWTVEELTPEDISGKVNDRPKFHVDESLPKDIRSSPDDYNGFTGPLQLDRFHLAAARNHSDTEAHYRATFNISNTAPGNSKLNEHTWEKLEDYCRSRVRPGCRVFVFTCSIWAPVNYPKSLDSREAVYEFKSIGEHHQQIPTHFGKSLLVKTGDSWEMRSWVMRNDDSQEGDDFREYEVVTAWLQEVSGCDVWKGLPDDIEHALETRMHGAVTK